MSTQNIRVDELIAAVGEVGALMVASHFGGQTMYFPTARRLRPSNRLVQKLGLDIAGKLCNEWPGLEVCVPRLAAQRLRARMRAIKREGLSLSANALAAQYGVTVRTVYAARKSKG